VVVVMVYVCSVRTAVGLDPQETSLLRWVGYDFYRNAWVGVEDGSFVVTDRLDHTLQSFHN